MWWLLRFLRALSSAVSRISFYLGLICFTSAGLKYISYNQEMEKWVDAERIYEQPFDPSELVNLLMDWSVVLFSVATVLYLLRWGLGKIEGVFYVRVSRFFRRFAGGSVSRFRGRRDSATAHSPAR